MNRMLAKAKKAHYISGQIQLMKHHLQAALLGIIVFITLPSSAQFSTNSVIGLGKDLAGKVKDSKKKKIIEAAYSTVQVNGKTMTILRVQADKISSNAKTYILKVQDQLNDYMQAGINRKQSSFPGYNEDIAMIRNLDSEWPADAYESELKEYRNFNELLVKQENKTNDSLRAIQELIDKENADRLAREYEKEQELIAYAERVKGYHFVNREYVLLRDKPNASGKVMGRIYAGSYVKVIGYSDGSNYVRISLQDIYGYIDQSELVDDLDRLSGTNADIATYKSRQYYKYLPNYDYVPEPEKVQEQVYSAPVRTSTPKPKQTSTSSAPKKQSYSSSRNYIRGPRGGCYYVTSGGSKVYVDRGMCD